MHRHLMLWTVIVPYSYLTLLIPAPHSIYPYQPIVPCSHPSSAPGIDPVYDNNTRILWALLGILMDGLMHLIHFLMDCAFSPKPVVWMVKPCLRQLSSYIIHQELSYHSSFIERYWWDVKCYVWFGGFYTQFRKHIWWICGKTQPYYVVNEKQI